MCRYYTYLSDVIAKIFIKEGHQRYRVSWASKDSSDWKVITQSVSIIDNGVLGRWDTAGLESGDYQLRLVVWRQGDTGNYPTEDYLA